MYERITALLPRGPQTALLPVPRGTERLTFLAKVLPRPREAPDFNQHPSFPNGMPAIIAERRPETVCPHCEWLARMIRAGRDVEQYAWTAIRHVDAAHPECAS